jgi:Flp pilus assembly protein TadG
MIAGRAFPREKRERGSDLIEFALVAFLCCILLVAFVEFGRFLLVYNSVANSARSGVRFAIVNGAGIGDGTRTGAGAAAVQAVVKNFAGSAPLDKTKLTVTVAPTTLGIIGSAVTVTVVYPYDPLSSYFPLSINLRSVSQGVIAF